MIPGRSIADANQDLVEFLVIDNCVPHGATAAELAVIAVPGGLHLGDDLIRCRAIGLGSFGRRHGVETPDLLAGPCVIGGHITANPVFCAAIADQDTALDDARRAGDRIGLALIQRDH